MLQAQELLLYHHHHLFNSTQKCANLVKLESLANLVRHLRATVVAERTARTLIDQVHAKTQIVVEEQRDEILKLEDTVELLKDEVDRLSARLVSALCGSRPTSESVDSAIYCRSDDILLRHSDDEASHSHIATPSPIFQTRLDDDLLDSISDHDSENESDDEADSGSESDPEEDQPDNNPLSLFQNDPTPTTPSTTPTYESHHLTTATTTLLHPLLANNISPHHLPTLLDSLALPRLLASQAALLALLEYISQTAPVEMPAQDLANRTRDVFRRHITLLDVNCTAPGEDTRAVTLSALADFSHAECAGRRKWRDAFGMIVYVLVDLEVVEAKDVVLWWAREKEGVFGASGCCGFMDKLCKTLEEYCSEESDEEEDEESEEESEFDEEEAAVEYERWKAEHGDLFEEGGEEKGNGSERRVSFRI
ncbi:hypothetical protein HDU98_005503 [Podochytrium sp. JEL0797]|nr:hypothetical protein HDU98_005503 [Podochytrium sp. JEL0797]